MPLHSKFCCWQFAATGVSLPSTRSRKLLSKDPEDGEPSYYCGECTYISSSASTAVDGMNERAAQAHTGLLIL